MPRDNEKIIEVLAHLQRTFKEALIPLIEADTPPWMISRVFEQYGSFSGMLNELSEEERHRGPMAHAPLHPGIVDAIASIEKQLYVLGEKLQRESE